MQILLVKLSSLGDVIHNFPVAADIRRQFPHAVIDWVTDATNASLVAMHPAVRRVIPIHLRALKKNWWQPRQYAQLFDDKAALARERYDLIIDTQGLVKSALVANWGNGNIAGYDKQSIREPFASGYYTHQYTVSRSEHAVIRNRTLAAAALKFTYPADCDYGLSVADNNAPSVPSATYAVLLHATSRVDKTWSVPAWVALGSALNRDGVKVILPSGNAAEYATSKQIAEQLDNAQAINAMPLPETTVMLGQAKLVVGVDTGLTHLAVALNRPTVGIYLTTSPTLTGLYASSSNDAVINLGGGTRQHAANVSVEDVLIALKLST
jgi:heptosyltransferase I